MTTFAKVNVTTNIVENVFITDDDQLGPEFGNPIHYVKSNDDLHPPIVGGLYDRENDRFLPVKLYESWTFDSDSYSWVAPVNKPDDFNMEKKPYVWNEENQQWELK